MNYANRSVSALIRGPLLHTPQGLVVLIVWAAYITLLPFVYTSSISLLGKTGEVGLVMCIAWPIVTCMYFIREGVSTTPDFKPSIPRALWLLLIGFAPLLWPIKDLLIN